MADPITWTSVLTSIAISLGVTAASFGLAYLFPQRIKGKQIDSIASGSSVEGRPITRHWGTNRLGGNVIWAGTIMEYLRIDRGDWGIQRIEIYEYWANFAVAFCEGKSGLKLGRVWADGKPLDIGKISHEFFDGGENWWPDGNIKAIRVLDGLPADEVPAYRGTCYLVFRYMFLGDFGNRIPEIFAEIISPADAVGGAAGSGLALIEAYALGPGMGAYDYGSAPYIFTPFSNGWWYVDRKFSNIFNKGATMMVWATNLAKTVMPRARKITIPVVWFCNDLRCNTAQIEPRVLRDLPVANALGGQQPQVLPPWYWSAGGYYTTDTTWLGMVTDTIPPSKPGTRQTTRSTPSDHTILSCISYLKNQGYQIVIQPIIEFYDAGSKPDPYNPSGYQRGYLHRSLMTLSVAPGVSGSPDKTSAARTEIDAFLGTVQAADFPGGFRTVTVPLPRPGSFLDEANYSVLNFTGNFYSHRATYRYFILAIASAVKDALGAGDAFLIGSQMSGLTRVRDGPSSYPFVKGLKTLAADVSSLLNSRVKIGYEADWREWNCHRANDGSGDVHFNLDPLWSDSNIDFVGIANFAPLTDWRDSGGLDFTAGYNPCDLRSWMRANVEGGEGYDWTYETRADRDAQRRTAIATTAMGGKPWILRDKDFRNWWLNRHYDRPRGQEATTPTGWTPGMKPIWFTAFGCPTVDKGSNQPDARLEMAYHKNPQYPYYSNKSQNTKVQNIYLKTMLEHWTSNSPSNSLGLKMIEPANMIAWSWDVRGAYGPSQLPEKWPEWRILPINRMFLTGGGGLARGGDVSVASVIADLSVESGLATSEIDVKKLGAIENRMQGFSVPGDRPAREIIETLGTYYGFDAFASEGRIKFVPRSCVATTRIDLDDLVADEARPSGFDMTRIQSAELPGRVDITVVDPENDYQPMTVSATSAGDSVNVISEEFSIVAAQTDATQVAHRIMAEAWIGAHTIRFGLGPSHLELDPGDAVVIGADPIRRTYRIQSIDVTERRSIEGLAYDPLIYGGIYVPPTDPTSRPQPPTEVFGPSQVWFADLPMLSDTMARPWAPRVFAWQNPFPPSVIVHASDDAGGWVANTTIRNAAAVGLSKYAFAGTPAPLWDRANSLEVETVPNVSLASTTDLAVLNGAHRAAIRHPTTGAWEVFAYRDAVLTDTNTYRLSRFLRGLNGTEDAIVSGAGVPAGATVVFLDASGDQPLRVDRDRIGEALEFRYGPNQAPPNDFRVRQETVRIAARGLKPFSPAHVRAQIGTDVRLTWIRRTRYNGDSWLPESVPLNEAREQYEVRVFAAGGTTAVRTERLATPNFTYTAQAMSSDFGGSRPSAFDIDVSQVSEEVGSGTPTKLRVSL